MATYAELYDLENDSAMRNKVRVAITIAADKIAEDNDDGVPFDQNAGSHDLRKAWVNDANAFNPGGNTVEEFWNAMLAKNESASVSAITSSTDASIQTNVETFVDIFAGV
jgi:hypothetical protein